MVRLRFMQQCSRVPNKQQRSSFNIRKFLIYVVLCSNTFAMLVMSYKVQNFSQKLERQCAEEESVVFETTSIQASFLSLKIFFLVKEHTESEKKGVPEGSNSTQLATVVYQELRSGDKYSMDKPFVKFAYSFFKTAHSVAAYSWQIGKYRLRLREKSTRDMQNTFVFAFG